MDKWYNIGERGIFMKLDSIFSSHMVLPAHKRLPISGSGNATVAVTFAGSTVIADPVNGRWTAELPAMEYGGPFEMTVSDCEECTVLEDIYIGEVFLCTGQSNMQVKIKETNTPPEEYADQPLLRMFATTRPAGEERFTPADGWIRCRKQDVADWTAIPYLAGCRAVNESGVAIGVIAAAQGSSVIRSWVPTNAFEQRGIPVPPPGPDDPVDPALSLSFNANGMLYNSVLSQVLPFPVSCVLWYQGESNTRPPEVLFYGEELRAFIEIWRKVFADPALPFVVVQIADFIHIEPEAADGWKLVQQAQAALPSRVNGVKTVVSADVCENDMIHPVSKKELSHRIADAALELIAQAK